MEMNRPMKPLNRIIVAMLLLLFAGMTQASVLSSFDGKAASIGDYSGKGKWLVVMIWASDCHYCNEEVESYDLYYKAHKDADARVLGISLDGNAGKRAAREFIARHRVSFPNLIGEPEAVTGLFTDLTGVSWRGTPTFLIYNPEGKLVVQQTGAVPVQMVADFIKNNQ